MKPQHNWMRRLLALTSLLLVCIVLFASCSLGSSQSTEPSHPNETSTLTDKATGENTTDSSKESTSDLEKDNNFEENPLQLDFYLQDNDTYAVAVGNATELSSIEIPKTFQGKKVAAILDKGFYSCANLKSIIIPDTITKIGNCAFSRCFNLTNITIPNSVTTLGDNAFSSCGSLNSVTIPDGVTSIGHDAFNGCTSLTSVTIGSGVTNIGIQAFAGCENLSTINLPDNLLSIGSGAFRECAMTNVTIPITVVDLGNQAFVCCPNLTNAQYEGTVQQWNSVANGKEVFFLVPATKIVCSNGTVPLS